MVFWPTFGSLCPYFLTTPPNPPICWSPFQASFFIPWVRMNLPFPLRGIYLTTEESNTSSTPSKWCRAKPFSDLDWTDRPISLPVSGSLAILPMKPTPVHITPWTWTVTSCATVRWLTAPNYKLMSICCFFRVLILLWLLQFCRLMVMGETALAQYIILARPVGINGSLLGFPERSNMGMSYPLF